MQKLTGHPMLYRAIAEPLPFSGRSADGLRVLLLATLMTMLSACGGGGSNAQHQSATLSGNWQFTMTNAAQSTVLGGLEGGFLLQSNGSVTGAAVYSMTLQAQNGATVCDSGSAPITGTANAQNVMLTATAGGQTFTLTGLLSPDGSTMSGTYASTANSLCGTTAQTGLNWSAILVPPLTGTIYGSFHSTDIAGGGAGLSNQDFPVTGTFTQSENIGASNATITGTLSFLDPTTNLSAYPCFGTASVNGQISGNSVILQIIGTDGTVVGEIGAPVNSANGVQPVLFDSVHGGYIMHGVGPSYLVASKACKGDLGGTVTAGDYGNICLALNNTTACGQPITLSPAFISFPAQMLGTTATPQTITLANNSSSTLNGLTLNFTYNGNNQFNSGLTDFNGLPSFTETDACGAGGTPSNGQSFTLNSGQSCPITVSFSPQESCPWIPFPPSPPLQSISGASPEYCPFPQTATVTATMSATNPEDSDNNFAVPVAGIGVSAIVPSTSELDFGAEEQLNPPEASLPQTLSFTNNSGSPLQILGSAPCTSGGKLPHPLLLSSQVAGLQVVGSPPGVANAIAADGSTITYNCDSDPGTSLPNFQISADTCTGTVLVPGTSCNLQIAYVPQPNTDINTGPDYFLELNTVQCSSTMTSDCEIDSGRFPVELRANTPSPLRMSPGAGLDFGNQSVGKSSAPLQITLLNDPALKNAEAVTFIGRITTQGNYSETDDCPVTLAPGSSCTLTVTFKPGTTGFLPGTLTINYSPEPSGLPQFVYLRGTGR